MKIYTLAMHLFKVLTQNVAIVPFTKRILHYENIATS